MVNMGRLERAAFFVILGILVIILVVMLKQGNSDEKEAAIFQVSIIINDENDDYWENFSKGVDSAAVDYNVDVHFVTLLGGVSAESQIYYLEREIRNNADAIVISAVDGESLA
jgi:ribose transport system substrate-binding protein